MSEQDRNLINEYLDGMLSYDDSKAFEKRLAEDTELQVEFEQLQLTKNTLKSLPEEESSDEFEAQLLGSIEEVPIPAAPAPVKEETHSRIKVPGRVFALAASVIVICLALSRAHDTGFMKEPHEIYIENSRVRATKDAERKYEGKLSNTEVTVELDDVEEAYRRASAISKDKETNRTVYQKINVDAAATEDLESSGEDVSPAVELARDKGIAPEIQNNVSGVENFSSFNDWGTNTPADEEEIYSEIANDPQPTPDVKSNVGEELDNVTSKNSFSARQNISGKKIRAERLEKIAEQLKQQNKETQIAQEILKEAPKVADKIERSAKEKKKTKKKLRGRKRFFAKRKAVKVEKQKETFEAPAKSPASSSNEKLDATATPSAIAYKPVETTKREMDLDGMGNGISVDSIKVKLADTSSNSFTFAATSFSAGEKPVYTYGDSVVVVGVDSAVTVAFTNGTADSYTAAYNMSSNDISKRVYRDQISSISGLSLSSGGIDYDTDTLMDNFSVLNRDRIKIAGYSEEEKQPAKPTKSAAPAPVLKPPVPRWLSDAEVDDKPPAAPALNAPKPTSAGPARYNWPTHNGTRGTVMENGAAQGVSSSTVTDSQPSSLFVGYAKLSGTSTKAKDERREANTGKDKTDLALNFTLSDRNGNKTGRRDEHIKNKNFSTTSAKLQKPALKPRQSSSRFKTSRKAGKQPINDGLANINSFASSVGGSISDTATFFLRIDNAGNTSGTISTILDEGMPASDLKLTDFNMTQSAQKHFHEFSVTDPKSFLSDLKNRADGWKATIHVGKADTYAIIVLNRKRKQTVEEISDFVQSATSEEGINMILYVRNADDSINVNKAGSLLLETLPGIDSFSARLIILYRARYGEYKSIDNLRNIPGMDPDVYDQIKNKLTTQ